jgi:hypothetical protein
MDVHIDQSGEHRHVAEIDHFCIVGHVDRTGSADRDNPIVDDDDRLVGQEPAGLDIDHLPGVDDDGSAVRRAADR